MLLEDFFTEVDKKRLNMAKVYGKRYAGREKWLFAELTKRYGAAKVTAMKERFERGNNGSVSSNSSEKSGAKSVEGPKQAKAPRKGHPRHPQFFHPPTPATGVNLNDNMAPAATVSACAPTQEHSSESPEGGETAEAPEISPPELDEQGRATLAQRPGKNNSDPSRPPPLSRPQDGGASNEAAPSQVTGSVSAERPAASLPMNGPPMTNGPSLRSGPPAMMQREKPEDQMNQVPFAPPHRIEKNSHAALAGLRQRRNVAGPGVSNQQEPDANAPPVTLEGLLKELYKKHQPDKLKNVQIVAKQYAGKERELVGLLKGKYGALSVKHLEENLEALERAHRARTPGKGAGKKRGCFIRTISLIFWLSVLLFFAFGAVFVSFVILDAQECRALTNDEEDGESAEDCAPLRKELETFTYERVGDYVRQSHHESCFCSVWMERESVVLTSLSGSDVVELFRLVPFSPDSFGEPWIASVKEQVPSQEFYDVYAKPVVDLSIDAGAFVWWSALEFAGLDDAPEKQAQTVSESSESDVVPLIEDEVDMPREEFDQAFDDVENKNLFVEATNDESGTEEVDVEIEASGSMTADANVKAFKESSVVDANDNMVGVLEVLKPSENDGMAAEHVDPTTEEVVVSEEEELFPSSTEENEEQNLLDEAIAELEFADDSVDFVIEDAESVSKDTEDESAARSEADVKEAPSEAGLNEESDIVDYDVDVLATETPVETGVTEAEAESAPSEDASVDVNVEGAEFAEEVAAATTIEVNGEESENVVEAEVHQEGLDVTYPQTTDTELAVVEQGIGSAEDLSRGVDDISEFAESVSFVESENDSEGAEVLGEDAEEALEEFDEATLNSTAEDEAEADEEEEPVTEDASEEVVDEKAVVNDDDVEVDVVGEGEVGSETESVGESDDENAVGANEHETDGIDGIVSEESTVAEDYSTEELSLEMELEEEDAEEAESAASVASADSPLGIVTSGEESVGDEKDTKDSTVSDGEVDGLELEHDPDGPEDDTGEGSMESETEMASPGTDELVVAVHEDEVPISSGGTDVDDNDESEEVDSGTADEKMEGSDEITGSVLLEEFDPAASDVEGDSVVSGDNDVEVISSEEVVGTEAITAEFVEDAEASAGDDEEEEISDNDISAETAVEETESAEVPAGVFEEKGESAKRDIGKESAADAISDDKAEGQPLPDDNVEAELEAESRVGVRLGESVEPDEDPVVALDVAIEAVEVRDDTIGIESGKDLQEERGYRKIEKAVGALDASAQAENLVPDADEALVSDTTIDAFEEGTLSELEDNAAESVSEAVAVSEMGDLQGELIPEMPVSADDLESGGLASAVNEVLARLVEPFESRKAAASVVVEDEALKRAADEL
ncbi:hypothetical protein PHYBOEH_002568 [Phytophthora boehmeriae]|uniref:Uncharacterized protein n=1 Tax=Phytophthora boehmeriae TaxID=109152 RepID=A0A8T1WXG2_9STRA|nr:hypothetical protein PHYBOEH_002568 [Phytophthora boehmeriae]